MLRLAVLPSSAASVLLSAVALPTRSVPALRLCAVVLSGPGLLALLLVAVRLPAWLACALLPLLAVVLLLAALPP